jgi:hypothetical protein
MREVRILGTGDEEPYFSFLERHLETSVFLVSNAERAGLVDRGEVLQGTYAAALAADRITAVASHYWNGNVVVQGDAGVEAAALAATSASGRAVRGILGPLAIATRVRTARSTRHRPRSTPRTASSCSSSTSSACLRC